MDLLLWRHAEAEPEVAAGGDLERRLTPKGERQAARMSEWLHRRLPPKTRIVVSPARRTRQTAKALGRAFETIDALAPGAAVEDVLAVASWPDAPEPVLVVGHQPVLGQVAARLLAGFAPSGGEREWALRKGAVIWLRRREDEGAAEVVLHAVQTPELL